MTRPNRIEISAKRLWDTLMRSGEIGPGRAGGLRRLALTDEDRAMRDQFVAWCEEAGMTVTVDGVGNLFACRAGRDNALAPVVIGSHLDTQVAGGRYDGILGVLAGLEIARTLNDGSVATRRPIEIVSWTNEEGARFQPPMIGSGAFAGVHPVDWVLARESDEGATFGTELERIGYAGSAAVGGRDLDSYFELHIEQGPELEAEHVDLGIVTGGYAVRGFNVDVKGETAHTGPTPMDRRKNALVGAALLIAAVNEVGWKHHAEGGKSTSARIQVWPNKLGILPEWAQVTLDFRHPEPEGRDRMEAEVRAAMEECAERANVEMTVVQEWTFGDEHFDPELVDLLEGTAKDLEVGYRKMLSQAGHDAYNIAHIAPTALLFSPCKDGITHNEAEHIELRYTVPGVNVLANAVLARADR